MLSIIVELSHEWPPRSHTGSGLICAGRRAKWAGGLWVMFTRRSWPRGIGDYGSVFGGLMVTSSGRTFVSAMASRKLIHSNGESDGIW